MKKLEILKIPASETFAINNIANERRHAGQTIYNLSAGEPMISASPVAVGAIMQALKDDKTHYPPPSGVPELRETAAKWMNGLYHCKFKKENTLVVNGGKFGIFILLQALLKPGDEVLIPAPYWVSYPTMVRIFKGTPITINTSEKAGWKITSKDILRSASRKSKILILNNAGNPTGALYSKAEIKNILITAKKLGLFVISDEVYSGLVYDKKPFISCASFLEFKDSVAIIQSCSKNFAVTGFRIGFVFASVEIIKPLGSLVSQSTSGVTTMCQYAILEVLKDAKNITRKINVEMQKRRDIFVGELNKMFKSKVRMPASGLYIFAPLSLFRWGSGASNEFCMSAMDKARVATVPGKAFGAEGYVRFSFGEKPDVLRRGLRALATWINKEGK